MSEVQTLLVVWQNKKSRLFYHIGNLSHYNGNYEFTYTLTGLRKLNDALNNGYMLHPAFPFQQKVYRSTELFSAFDRRLPSSDRADFIKVLHDLGLNQHSSKMDILKETRGRLASDSYSFEQPLKVDVDNKLRTSFFVHGMRHQNLPDNWADRLAYNTRLELINEPTNLHDPYAVAIYTQGGQQLGYVPAFYSKAIFALIQDGAQLSANVSYINELSTPHWWLKLNFESTIPSLEKKESEELNLIMQ